MTSFLSRDYINVVKKILFVLNEFDEIILFNVKKQVRIIL